MYRDVKVREDRPKLWAFIYQGFQPPQSASSPHRLVEGGHGFRCVNLKWCMFGEFSIENVYVFQKKTWIVFFSVWILIKDQCIEEEPYNPMEATTTYIYGTYIYGTMGVVCTMYTWYYIYNIYHIIWSILWFNISYAMLMRMRCHLGEF